jgi:hypothetical protein
MYEAWRHMDRQLRHNPMITKNLVGAGAQLHIIGKNQVTSDLPDFRRERDRIIDEKGNTIDTRTRGSHHIFRRHGVRELINLQREGSKAEVYQVRQVRQVVVRYGLEGEKG